MSLQYEGKRMKVRIFRILAVFFSIVLFAAGIVSALSIFMSLTGHSEPSNDLFFLGSSIFLAYHFSAFLIPLLFLYAAVLLLIPGWSRESAFILAGFPVYFITAIIGEQIIYRLLPMSSIPLIKQFVTVSVLICTLLFMCFEVFLMIVLAGKRALQLSAKHSSDVVNDTYAEDIQPQKDEEKASSEKNKSEDQSGAAYSKDESADITDGALEQSEPKQNESEYEESESAIQTEESAPREPNISRLETDVQKNETDEQAIADVSFSRTEPTGEDDNQKNHAFDVPETVIHDHTHAIEHSDAAPQPFTIEDAIKAEAASGSDDYRLDLSETDDTPETIENEPEEITACAAEIEAFDAEEMPEPFTETSVGNETESVIHTVEESPVSERDVAPLPSFDPEDPNNLFDSLEEITADVKRISERYDRTEKHEQESEIEPVAEKETAPVDTDSEPAVEDTISLVQENTAYSPHLVTEVKTSSNAAFQDDEYEIDFNKLAPLDSIEETAAPSIQQPVGADSVAENHTFPPVVPQDTESTVEVVSQQQDESDGEQDTIHEPVVAPKENLKYMPVPNQVSDLIDTLVVIDEEEPDVDVAAARDADFFEDDSDEENDDEDDDKTVDELFKEKAVVEEPLKPAPKLTRKKYAVPFDLLTHYPDGEYWVVDDATRKAAMMLKSTFNEFKIDVSITGIRKGPVVTMFEMLPSPGIKLSKITNLQDNIALRLAASNVRIVAPIPGKHAVGIEVPNKKRAIVSFRELIEADLPESEKMAIPVMLGKDVTGNPQILDLAQTPHLLIAGATGSGKSVCVNSIILSILYNRRPDEVKLILVDPKIVELKLYNDIGHLLSPVITEPKRAFQALQYCLCEMERRYALLDNMGVRDIKTFNARIKGDKIAMEKLPYIVIIIDEFADLMATSGKELEATVSRLCAMSRAVGIHLVLATQRPSIDVITGLIKANIPSRIAFMVASKTDSRIILDEGGAEKLLGKGDMLFISAATPFPTRMQGAFVSEQEVERVVDCVKDYCEPEYIDDEIFVDDEDDSYDSVLYSENNDPLYDQALEIVTFAGKASASYVQRKLKIGYNRAARLIEEMEARGIVGPPNGSKPREVLRH